MHPTPYVASLRIYEPLSAFSPSDQLRWRAVEISESTHPSNQSTSAEEQVRALIRTIRPESPRLRADGAHVLDVDGERYISPWSTAMRCWAALDTFKESLPSSITKYFITPALEDAISSEAEDLDDRVPHILTETWVVPPRWFALFEPNERMRGIGKDGPFTILRTDISVAKLRCENAHQAVINAFGNGPIEGEIAALLAWLNVFHPASKLELDYGGLALYLDRALRVNGGSGIDDDSSIEDVALSLQGLASGDGALAGQGYERLVSRWRKVGAFEQAM
ncbi:MAG: hypothetical protein ACO4AM_06615 [Candidatus Nanopelagicaceae bacterium]